MTSILIDATKMHQEIGRHIVMEPDFSLVALSTHASRRAARRAIPPHAINLVLDYGAVQRVNGADSYFFDSAARRRLRRELDQDGWRHVERHLGLYAVVADDGRIITVARRRRRLRRP